MKRILLGILLFCSLGLCEIKESYSISSNEIYSTHLLPKAPKFLIARFGENFSLTLPAQKLKDLFASHSLAFNSPYPQITFIYHSPLPLTQVKEKISQALILEYPKIQIQDIKLKPIGRDIDPQTILELKTIQNAMFKKKSFQILLNTSMGVMPFLCEVQARLEVYVAREDIRAREELSVGNVERKWVEFEGFIQPPISESEFFSSSARSFIKQGQIITINKIKPKLFVKKGDMIEVSLQEGGVKITSRLEAMQNGALGEEIIARNPTSKKNIKIKIIGVGKGEVK